MSKIWMQALLLLFGWALLSPAYAILDLQLMHGVQGALPIAIVPFSGQNDLQAYDNIAAIIQNDLRNSGRFKPMDFGRIKSNPHDISQVDFNYWSGQGINNIVVGSVTREGLGNYKVNFQLLDVYGRSLNAQPHQALLHETFTVSDKNLRALAHHISDMIYQKLTGDRGIFSTRIAYVLVTSGKDRKPNYRLEVADADGFNPKALFTSDQPIMSPAWSADGKYLAYVSFEGGKSAIYLQNVASGNRRLLSSHAGVNGAPAFSKDGNKLALVLTENTGYLNIYTVDLAGGQLLPLTSDWSINTEPRFAGDGQSLIFTSNRGGSPQIYRLWLATNKLQRISYDGSYNASASFLPDGSGIIMLHRDNGNYQVVSQDFATGRITNLTQYDESQSPSIAPNGKMVVYATKYQGQQILAMVSIDGRVKLRLPARDGNVREPAWSPFLN